MIAVGDPLPDVEVRTMGTDGPVATNAVELLGTGKVLLIGVPGAFTRGCSHVHLPGYLARMDEVEAAGFDQVACTAVNDAWVMAAWQRDLGAERITMVADGEALLADAVGLTMHLPGLGVRSRRYAAVLDDGTLTSLFLEPAPGIDVSSCSHVLAQLSGRVVT